LVPSYSELIILQDFVYEHEKSWPALVELCNSLRAERKERWHKLGGSVGLSEWDIKGGAPQPKTQPVAANGTTQHNDSPPTYADDAVTADDLPDSKSDTVLV
jgi:hypothetical protein